MPETTFLKPFDSHNRKLLMLKTIDLEPEFFHLFQKGLETGILSPNDIASILSEGVEEDRDIDEKTLDWLLFTLGQFGVRIVSDKAKKYFVKPNQNDNGLVGREQRAKNREKKTISYPKRLGEDVEEPVEPTDNRDLLTLYLKEIGGIPLLKGKEEEKELGRRAKKYRRAREEFIKANLRLPVRIARTYQGRGVEYQDLIQEGNIGLLKAVEEFDPDRYEKFSTIAFICINQAITRAIHDRSDLIRKPVHERTFRDKIIRISKKLARVSGREPEVEEIAREIGCSVDEVEQVLRRMREVVVDLEDLSSPECDENENASWEKIISNNSITPEVYVLAKEEAELTKERLKKIEDGLRFLFPWHAEIFRSKFGFDGSLKIQTLQSVAYLYGRSKERIRQILNKSMKVFKSRGLWDSEDYESLEIAIEKLERLQEMISEFE